MARKQYYSRYGSMIKKRRRSRVLIFVLFVSLFLIGGGFLFKTYRSVSTLVMTQGEPRYLNFEEIPSVKTWRNKEVKFAYLTFDNGPSANTLEILSLLDSEDVDGTFFLLGTSIESHLSSKDILNQMLEEGHYIGVKGMTQDYQYLYTEENAVTNFVDSMNSAKELVSQLTDGYESELCRAPFGTGGTFTDEHVTAITDAGFRCWDWDVDSNDWSTSYSKDDVLEKVKSDMALWGYPSNAVILLHERDVTLEALPEIIEYLRSLGYEFLPYNPNNHLQKNLYNSSEL